VSDQNATSASNSGVAVITGGTKGIGLAVARRFAEEGRPLVVSYRRDKRAATHAVEEFRSRGLEVALVECDLSVGAQPIIEVLNELGRPIHAVVCNAAASAFKPLLEMQSHHVAKTFGITVGSLLELVQGTFSMMSSGSSIVTISSGDSLRYIPGHGLLGAAKAALEVLTRYLALELAEHGIRVNCVLPGPVETDSARIWAGPAWDGFVERASRATPLGRLGQPVDIAAVVHLLCQPAASWISGQVVVADGGMFFNDLIFSA
jgi:enoyl-[acyl-carrier protein] reductase III